MAQKKTKKRNIIVIDEDKCNGCGQCIPNCPEGAIQIVDNKARLISDLLCDGLGACLGYCPEGAISLIEREAEPYDERKVMANMVKQGANVVKAHLAHLRDHQQTELLSQATAYLEEKGIDTSTLLSVDGERSRTIENPLMAEQKAKSGHGQSHAAHHGGCPGAKMFDFSAAGGSAFGGRPQAGPDTEPTQKVKSQLRQWPIQMHLISPMAPYYQGADVVLAADCTAFALGSFHADYLKGKALAIACPKLDENQEVYVEKIKALLENAKINTLTVLIMQVPCCRGLLGLAQQALGESKRKVPIKYAVVSLQGEILQEEWL